METFPIVVVASSARDLEPVVELLSALPAGADQAFIIVQHLDPGRRYIPLNDVLAKRVAHPVAVAQDGVRPERGHIYVMRANVELTIINGLISVLPATAAIQHPGDMLFTSLAADRGNHAIGVVLSGGGSDGALGVRAIDAAGGATFAQYPGSARFPSMPISAIETGCAGWILRPNEIALELARLSRHLTTGVERDHPQVSALPEPAIAG
jgi:two-component system, chemotaxis family, CheB/CheR fusion protein